jgi:hypothetical protein
MQRDATAQEAAVQAGIQRALERLGDLDLEIAHLVIDLEAGSELEADAGQRIADALSQALGELAEVTDD